MYFSKITKKGLFLSNGNICNNYLFTFFLLLALLLCSSSVFAKSPDKEKKPVNRQEVKPHWLKTEKPTKEGLDRLKKYSEMVENNIKLQNNKLYLNVDPGRLAKLGIPKEGIDSLQKSYIFTGSEKNF